MPIDRLVAEPAGVVHRQPVVGAGHIVGVRQIDDLVVVEDQVAGRLARSCRVWQATQLRSRIGLTSR